MADPTSEPVPAPEQGPSADRLVAAEDRPLTEAERVGDTFVAPSKTFADIRQNARWWAPYVIGVLVSIFFMFAVAQRIGWERVAQNTMAQSPQQQERINNMPPEQQAATYRQVAGFIKGTAYATPVLSLLFLLVIAAVLYGTMHLGFGGRATFGQMFAVVNYAFLPNSLKYLLATAMLYAAPDVEHFNLQNPVGTNIGYYLSPETPRWLVSLTSSMDVVTIWIVALLVIGCAITGRVRKGSAAVAVVGWWMLAILVGAGWAALRS